MNLAEGRKSEVSFVLPTGRIRVTYNQSYGRSAEDPRKTSAAASYSLTLRPDVSVVLSRGTKRRRLLLDAKYRVDGFSKALQADQDDEDDALEATGQIQTC